MASKVSVVGIVAWVLVVVLAIGAGALGFLFQKQSARATGLQDALAQVAATAGVQDLAADAALPDVLQKVQGTIQGVQQELAAAQGSLTAAQAEAAGAKTEAATLSQKVQEQTAAAEAAAKDLTAKDEALAAAKAETEKAAQDAKAAQEAADRQKAELEGTIAGLKAQMAEETARLQAELEAARQPPPVAEGALAEGEGLSEEAEPAVSPEEAAAQAARAEEEQARILGQSSMISLIRYAPDGQILYLRLLDGQELSYRDVPRDVYDQLVASPDKLDMTYRFKIQGAFKSLPPDSVVVRKYWKWHRRNKAPQGDVRVIDPPAPPAVEEPAASVEESAEEVASAEAPAEETTPAAASAAEVVPAEASDSVVEVIPPGK